MIRVRSLKRNFLGVILVVVISGCFSSPRFLPQGVSFDSDRGSRECLAIKAKQQGASTSYRALVEALVVGEGATFRYAVASRDSLNTRIDVLPPEGAFTLGIFVVRDGEASFVDVAQKRYRMQCTPEDLYQEFFQIEGLSPQLVTALLTGIIPLDSCSNTDVYYAEDGKILTLLDRKHNLAWSVDYQSGELRSVTLLNDENSRVVIRARRTMSEQDLPRIDMSIFKPIAMTLELTTKRLHVGVELPASLFSIYIPSAYHRESC